MRGKSISIVVTCVMAIAILATPGYAAIPNGLVARYSFNGDASDESGNGNYGIVYGALLDVDLLGRERRAFSFNGVDNYIDLGNARSLDIHREMTVTCLFKIDALIPSSLVFADMGESGSPLYSLSIDEKGSLYGEYYGEGGPPDSYFRVTAVRKLSPGFWYFAALVRRDDHTLQLYVNGVKQPVLKEGVATRPNASGLVKATIGRAGSTQGGYFKGVIDDVRIYNKALRPRQIFNLFDTICKPPDLAGFRASLTTGKTPLIVDFIARGFDRNGDIAEYRWDFDGDGKTDVTSAESSIVFPYREPGKFNASVTAVDNTGVSASSTPIQISSFSTGYVDITGSWLQLFSSMDGKRTIGHFMLKNQGSQPAGLFTVQFHYSSDGSQPRGRPIKKFIVRKGIAPDGAVDLVFNKVFKRSVKGHYIIATIDANEQAQEMSEANNEVVQVIR